jgi:hypothetical protein
VLPYFKRKEAYVLSVFIGLVAFALEWFVLFSDTSSGGGRGKALVAIPVGAFILIKSIFKNTRKS